MHGSCKDPVNSSLFSCCKSTDIPSLCSQDVLPLASWPHSNVLYSLSVIACCPCEAAADVHHILVRRFKACFSIARQSANVNIREVVDDVMGCLLCYVMH